MIRFFALSLGLITSLFLSAHATTKGWSAARPAHVSGRALNEMHLRQSRLSQWRDLGQEGMGSPSALDSQTDQQKAHWERVPEVSAQDLERLYLSTRDQFVLKDRQQRARRITWLYPDDGCFARAEMVAELWRRAGAPAPAKIFAFGDLKAETTNHPDGSVTWWYHVAPIVRSQGEIWVLDAALNPREPLRWQDWMSRLGDRKATISICVSRSYDPGSSCEEGLDPTEAQDQAMSDELRFLEPEWVRVERLGRNPEKELGEQPPWLAPLKALAGAP